MRVCHYRGRIVEQKWLDGGGGGGVDFNRWRARTRVNTDLFLFCFSDNIRLSQSHLEQQLTRWRWKTDQVHHRHGKTFPLSVEHSWKLPTLGFCFLFFGCFFFFFSFYSHCSYGWSQKLVVVVVKSWPTQKLVAVFRQQPAANNQRPRSASLLCPLILIDTRRLYNLCCVWKNWKVKSKQNLLRHNSLTITQRAPRRVRISYLQRCRWYINMTNIINGSLSEPGSTHGKTGDVDYTKSYK